MLMARGEEPAASLIAKADSLEDVKNMEEDFNILRRYRQTLTLSLRLCPIEF